MSNTSVLYSIGHGAKTLEAFIAELEFYRIQYLVDVRSKPYSKWCPHFKGDALERSLMQVGIKYVYMGDLLGGMPSDEDCYTIDGKVDYSKVAQKDFFKEGLQRLLNANEKRLPLAIMCSEREPEMCHRSKLIGEELSKQEVDLWHILGKGCCICQADIFYERGGLFPDASDPDFTSRGSHREKVIGKVW